MKVGVISDTHDRLPPFRRALAMFQRLNVEAILHAGDLVAPFAAKLLSPQGEVGRDGMGQTPVHVIYGNNDGERAGLAAVLPQIVDGPIHIALGGHRVLMHHFVEWIPEAAYITPAPDGKPVDIVISGHDHTASVAVRDHPTRSGHRTLFLNPGECCGWVTDRCSVAVLDLDQPLDEMAQIIDVQP